MKTVSWWYGLLPSGFSNLLNSSQKRKLSWTLRDSLYEKLLQIKETPWITAISSFQNAATNFSKKSSNLLITSRICNLQSRWHQMTSMMTRRQDLSTLLKICTKTCLFRVPSTTLTTNKTKSFCQMRLTRMGSHSCGHNYLGLKIRMPRLVFGQSLRTVWGRTYRNYQYLYISTSPPRLLKTLRCQWSITIF